MEFDGYVRKDRNSNYWNIYIPAFDLMTQGKSKNDAFDMIEDALYESLLFYFGSAAKNKTKFYFHKDDGSGFGVSSNNNKLLLSLALRRQRELSHSTVREAASRLRSKSPNAYSQYERGRLNISLDNYERLLFAANPDTTCSVRVG